MSIDEEIIKKEVEAIRERNKKVEADKAWETSYFRIFSIVILTYIIASLILLAIGNDHPIRNALIPAFGYFLSTLSLPFVKKRWITKYLKSSK